MKKIKKIMSIVLVLAMTIPMVSLSSSARLKAATTFMITSPTANQLVAAGYIDIEWEAATNGTVSNYEVYIDDVKVTTTKSTSYEYYTTKVKAFDVYVKANYSNGTSETAETITFGVSKKGLGLASDMGANINLRDMGVAWYYNWGESPSSGNQYAGIEYVPMVWKETNANNFKTRVERAKNRGYKYILTFNEPDLQGQCDMPVNDVYNVWKGINNMEGIKISSPVTALWPQASSNWFQPFMTKIDENGDYQPDFISIHCYPDNYGGAGMASWFLENVVDWAWEEYGLPIWITEFSTTGSSITATGVNGTKEFWERVMPGLDAREYVERYAAFGFNSATTGLWSYSTGVLTPGGHVYSQLGNPANFTPAVPPEPDYEVLTERRNELLDSTKTINKVVCEDYINAEGVTAISDSEIGNGGVASNAIDDDVKSRWESKHDEDNVSLIIDLGSTKSIKEVDIVWESASASLYNIEISIDGIIWTTVAEGVTGSGGRCDMVTLKSLVSARYVKIYGIEKSTDYGYSIYDVAIYGTEDVDVDIPIYTVEFCNDGNIVDSQNISRGEAAVAPKLEKEGYTLSWDKSFDNITRDTKIYAVWTPSIYEVVFKNEGQIVETQKVGYGSAAIAPTLEKEGYILSWDKSFNNITEDLEVNAVWTAKTYEVIFKNEGQTVETQKVGYGSAATAPALKKEGCILSWDKSFDNVTENLEVNAVWTAKTYEVIFKNDGQEVETQKVGYGSTAMAPILEKEGYTLSWDKSFDNVTGDLEVNAVWTLNKYKVSFRDGNVTIKEQEIYHGYAAIAPELAKTGYTLSWDKSFDNITSELTVNAVWTINKYDVVFMNDEEVVDTQDVEYGSSATAPELEKEGYTLSWDKSFDNITGDLTVNAVWTINKYDVVFIDDDEIVDIQEVEYGSFAIAPELEKEGYTLSWDISFDEVTEDLEVNAIWTINRYDVIFINDNEVVDIQEVEYGSAAIAPELEKEGHTLSWDISFDEVTEDLEVNAVWTINSYKVVFKDGESTIKEQEVYYGYAAVAPELAKPGYILSWDKAFDNITDNVIINAVWTLKEVETTTKEEKPTETTTVNKETTTNKVKLAKTKIKKATKKKASKKAKISLKKIKGASGYQVQISKKKSFKTVLVKKNVKKVSFSISSKKIKKLKKIYVRARAFVKKNGKKHYGAWSKVKKIKIK